MHCVPPKASAETSVSLLVPRPCFTSSGPKQTIPRNWKRNNSCPVLMAGNGASICFPTVAKGSCHRRQFPFTHLTADPRCATPKPAHCCQHTRCSYITFRGTMPANLGGRGTVGPGKDNVMHNNHTDCSISVGYQRK